MNTTDGTRSFGGKLSNFKDRRESNFEAAHLKAYLKGHKTFTFGFDWNTTFTRREKVRYAVHETLS